MSNVVDLKKAREDARLILVCPECGCTTFHFYADLGIICGLCGQPIHDDVGWMKKRPDTDKVVGTADPCTSTVVTTGSSEVSWWLKNEAKEDVVYAITMHRDGKLRTWRDIRPEGKQVEWFKRRMRDAKRMLLAT